MKSHSLQQELEVVEKEEKENVIEEENCVDLNDDEIGTSDGSEPSHSGAHLTSPDADRKVLLCGRNVMTPWIVFSNDAVVERAELPPLGPTIETQQAKREKQSCPGFGMEVFPSFVANDSILAKLLALEKWVQRMAESNFTKQSLVDQAIENHKMMMQHQKEMAESQKEFMKITRDSIKDMFNNLPTMVMSIVQKV